MQVKLNDTLAKDQEYLVELYISRAERSIRSLKEFGVYFTDKKIINISDRGLAIKPQVDFVNEHGFRSKRRWMKLSAVYKGEGTEVVLIFGHFNYEPYDDKRWILCHYYIDDVSITPIKSEDNDRDAPKGDLAQLQHEQSETMDSVYQIIVQDEDQTKTLNNVFFSTNQSELLPSSFSELDQLVQYLKEDRRAFIKIIGHTDNTGSEDQNTTLSEQRAKVVAEYLMLNGIDRFRVSYIGYGSSKPIATNNTEDGKQLNRRVEFTIIKRE